MSKQLRCFGRQQPHKYIRWHSIKTTWMKGDIFEAWILQLNNQFKGQNQRWSWFCKMYLHMLLAMPKLVSLMVSTLELSNMTLVFLPPNVTSIVKPLDQGIITSFKIQYKEKLLKWVLSQYNDATLNDLRKVVPNIIQAIMWSYKGWSELDAQIVRYCWRMACILHGFIHGWGITFGTKDLRNMSHWTWCSSWFTIIWSIKFTWISR